MKRFFLESKYCKRLGYYFDKVIATEVTDENYLDYGVPFRFGFVRLDKRYDFPVPNIQAEVGELIIHTYRDFDFKAGAMVRIDNKFYYVESFNVSYEGYDFMTIKHYYLTIK